MRHFVARVCALAALVSLAIPANAEFCSRYAQVWSSAGRCDACRLTITPTTAQNFRVESNNGWKAELGRIRGPKRIANGRGSWLPGSGRGYGGKDFEVVFTPKGNRLTMGMLVQMGGRHKVILAGFRCLDRDFVSALR